MKKSLPELSKSEWLIMNICWKKDNCTVRCVYEQLFPTKKWEYPTVKTMMDRIVKKGYLKREKIGCLYIYVPEVSHKQVTKDAIQGFMNTVLDNTFAPIFSHFVSEKQMSKKDINSLQKLVEKYEEEHGTSE
ncbi:BlaI/MecI/CopY family transcriptional regulator [Candidatus Uabimicrobium sp. HlEnr_7]|uniref:BlaI/MecI/CopY family transcriptional regulator n=1 Tax=Candidatus Uabimicrobium helgolandensis TaxID=3095367 RepID=UPI0035575857